MNRSGGRNNEPSAGDAHQVSGRPNTKLSSVAKEEGTPAKAGKTLTKADREQLQRLEAMIGSGLVSFVEVGRALNTINASRLYREASDTFEDYCEQKWDMSREYGYRLIKAAKCYDLLKGKLPSGARLPSNESQLRPLVASLKPDKWVQAWKTVIADTSGVRLTAEAVEKVVHRLQGKSSHASPGDRKKAPPKLPKQAVATIINAADRVLRKVKPSVAELRRVLTKVRDDLRRLSSGAAS